MNGKQTGASCENGVTIISVVTAMLNRMVQDMKEQAIQKPFALFPVGRRPCAPSICLSTVRRKGFPSIKRIWDDRNVFTDCDAGTGV